MESYRQTIDEVLAAFDSNAQSGLTNNQVDERRNGTGSNELTAEPPVPAWRKFLAQFKDVLVILLIATGFVSAGLWLYERDSALPYEAIAIFAVVLLNAVMGYVQEARAESAVAALRQMAAAHAKVIRDGERRSVPAAELVPGDIIAVEEGDTVPADARLIESTALQTAEAALTGESLPVVEGRRADRRARRRSATATTWSSAARRRPTAAAARWSPRPGMQTEMGRIAGLLQRRTDGDRRRSRRSSTASASCSASSSSPSRS